MFKKLLLSNKNSGMTFIELIVVMGIFTAISATVLFNYRDFSDGVALQNLAQEIALQGKRAQTLASQGRSPINLLSDAQRVNVENTPNFLPTDWVSSYGLAFDTQNMSTSFVFYFNSPAYYAVPDSTLNSERSLYFEDFVVGNYYFGCEAAVSECVDEIVITDGSYIELLCLNSEPRTDENCESSLAVPTNQLHVSFTRPFLESYIVGDDPDVAVSNAFIKISSRDGSQKRYIEFWSTGQISVN